MSEIPPTERLTWPITPYEVTGYRFRQRVRRRWILWATHLGDDVVAAAGTPVAAIGQGRVVWAEMRRGSVTRRNWGGLIVVAHRRPRETAPSFYSLYGHLTDLAVGVDDEATEGQRLGVVAAGSTPENGFWVTPHLHFAIYTGPWQDQVLPGYHRFEQRRTKLAWWQDPQSFITTYTV